MLDRLIRSNKHNEDGAAMLVVTCVMAVISILCLSILLAGYQMYATVSDETADERYYQQALSFSKVLEDRLTGDRDDIDSGTVEDFIFDYMNDDEDYPFDDEDGVTLKITSTQTGDSSAYGTININLTKEEESPGSGNMWADSKKSYLYVKVDVLAGDEVKATVSAKYEYEYAVENYQYYYTIDGNDTVVDCKLDPNDSSKVIIYDYDDKEVGSVAVQTLINNGGEYSMDGNTYHFKRSTLAGDKGFELSFIGFY
jgi:hypothetical protein